MNDVLPVASYLPRIPRPPRSLAYHLFLATNPFYLLSAACMLAGCTALSNSLSWSPIKLNRLLMLIATLNLYELLLVGLGLYLLVVRRLRRDATILLILEAFFLADVTFLNHEIYAEDVRVGAIVNAIVLVLAFAKLAAVFRCLRVPLASGPFALVMTQIALLLGMPGVFRQIVLSHDNTMPPLAIYGAWWVVALLPILASVLLRDPGTRSYAPAWVRSRAIFGVLIIVPVASILAHLCLANWVYNVRWYTANLSPVLMGLAVA